jgi:hypothetical protein
MAKLGIASSRNLLTEQKKTAIIAATYSGGNGGVQGRIERAALDMLDRAFSGKHIAIKPSMPQRDISSYIKHMLNNANDEQLLELAYIITPEIVYSCKPLPENQELCMWAFAKMLNIYKETYRAKILDDANDKQLALSLRQIMLEHGYWISPANVLLFFRQIYNGKYKKDIQHITGRGLSMEFLVDWLNDYKEWIMSEYEVMHPKYNSIEKHDYKADCANIDSKALEAITYVVNFKETAAKAISEQRDKLLRPLPIGEGFGNPSDEQIKFVEAALRATCICFFNSTDADVLMSELYDLAKIAAEKEGENDFIASRYYRILQGNLRKLINTANKVDAEAVLRQKGFEQNEISAIVVGSYIEKESGEMVYMYRNYFNKLTKSHPNKLILTLKEWAIWQALQAKPENYAP